MANSMTTQVATATKVYKSAISRISKKFESGKLSAAQRDAQLAAAKRKYQAALRSISADGSRGKLNDGTGNWRYGTRTVRVGKGKQVPGAK